MFEKNKLIADKKKEIQIKMSLSYLLIPVFILLFFGCSRTRLYTPARNASFLKKYDRPVTCYTEIKSPLISKHRIFRPVINSFCNPAFNNIVFRNLNSETWQMSHPGCNKGFNKMIKGEEIEVNRKNIFKLVYLYIETGRKLDIGKLVQSQEELIDLLFIGNAGTFNYPDSVTFNRISSIKWKKEGKLWKVTFFTYEYIGTGNIDRWVLMITEDGIVKNTKKEILEEDVGRYIYFVL